MSPETPLSHESNPNKPEALKRLERSWSKPGDPRFLCIGLDPDVNRLPDVSIDKFNKKIIFYTKDSVCAFKPNFAFYEREGEGGMGALYKTFERIDRAKQQEPNLISIADAKRGGSQDENEMYARSILDNQGADSMTVSSGTNLESLTPYFERRDKLIFIWDKSSNPSSRDFQDGGVKMPLNLEDLVEKTQELPGFTDRYTKGYVPLYLAIAYAAVRDFNKNGNVGLVVGATHPQELDWTRRLCGDVPILVPGIGSQGGSIEDVMRVGLNSRGGGLILSSSSDIIYAGEKDPEYDKVYDIRALYKASANYNEIKKYHKIYTQAA